MSSEYVRDEFKTFLAANSAETIIDMSGEFRTIENLLTDESISRTDDWVGVQFTASIEEPITIIGGCYREFGVVLMHVVAPISINVFNLNILPRGDALRAKFRGKRINDIVIESITPLNTERGTTIEFDNGWTSGTFFVNYYRDLTGV